jgi:fucose permease
MMTNPTQQTTGGVKRAKWPDFLVYAGFALTGVATTLLGPTLPWLKERWHMNDAQAGYLFVQFLGQLLGTVASGWIVARVGATLCLAGGASLMAIGIAGLSTGNWDLGLFFLFVNGLGVGVNTPTTNLLVSHRHPQNRAAALSFVNLIWGIGAVLCPFVWGFLFHSGHGEWFVYGMGILMLLLAMSFLTLREKIAMHTDPGAGAATAIAVSTVVLFAVLLFLYVGTETAVGNWSAVRARRIDVSGEMWSVMPSFFWLGLLGGRGLAPLILRSVREFRLAMASLVLGFAGVIAFILARRIPLAAVSIMLAGLGFAAIFPILVGWMTHRFGPAGNRLASWAFVSASLGGAVLPWLVGQVAGVSGDLRLGYGVPLVAIVAMLLLVPKAVAE